MGYTSHDAPGFPNNPDGYGVYVYNDSSYNLVENNAFYRIGAGVMQSSASANAYLYNYVKDITINGWLYQLASYDSNHGAHPMMNLWEGNVGQGFASDGYHGSASHQTLFRNWFHGLDGSVSNGGNRKMVSLERGSYYHNIVGNI